MYYFVNLIFHLLVSLGILFLILISFRRNRTRKVNRGVYFLLPTVLTILFLLQSILYTIPRAIDMIYILKDNYRTASGVVTDVGFLNNTVEADGTKYYMNPFLYKPVVGDHLIIVYTPNAHYAVELRPSADETRSSD